MRKGRFFLWMSLAMAAVAVFAFAPTYYFRSLPDLTGAPDLPGHIQLHGAAMTAWILLPIIQTALVAFGWSDVHRKVGYLGFAIAAVLIPTGAVTVIRSVPRFVSFPQGPPPADLANLVVGDFLSLIVFPLMLLLGYLRRNDLEAHRRWMMLSTVALWGPVMGRFIAIWQMPLLAVAFSPLTWIIALLIYDVRTRRRPHRVTLMATGLLVVGFVAPQFLSQTSTARAWMVSWGDTRPQ